MGIIIWRIKLIISITYLFGLFVEFKIEKSVYLKSATSRALSTTDVKTLTPSIFFNKACLLDAYVILSLEFEVSLAYIKKWILFTVNRKAEIKKVKKVGKICDYMFF